MRTPKYRRCPESRQWSSSYHLSSVARDGTSKAGVARVYSVFVKSNSLSHLPSEHSPGRLARWWTDSQHRGLLRISTLTRRLRPGEALPKHLETGLRGEFEALFFLQRQGFIVIERRWRSPELNGDLDLIAWEADTLCFIEVKARSERNLNPASSAVDSYKQRMLSRMAAAFLRTLPQLKRREVPIRFDVVSVYLLPSGVECELVRHAFQRQN